MAEENDEAAGDDESTPERPSTRACLADLTLSRTLTPEVLSDLRADRCRCLIIEVPSASWVEPMVDAAGRLLWNEAHCIGASEPPRRQYRTSDQVSMASSRRPVVAISQAAERCLEPAILSACDLRLIVPAPHSSLVVALSRLCLIEPIDPAALDGLVLVGLDFNEIAACLPMQATAELAVRRLRNAIARKTDAAAARLPSLEAAHGYGAAQRWATDLRIDLEDYRAGRIAMEDVDRGCLIYGPPGTGKSLFSRIVARACTLPIVTATVGELFATGTGHLGDVIHALRAVFQQAKEMAPSLLFLDELDALPSRGSISGHDRSWWLPVVTDFLTMLDSTLSNRTGIVVIGATNHLEQVEPALLRPGRLERSIWVGPPDAPALAAILHHYLGEDLAAVDLLSLAQARLGSTGAEAEEWARAARRTARRAGRPMSYEDLAKVVLPPDPRSPSERQRAAFHEAGHAVAGVLLGIGELESVTIQASRDSGGRTTFKEGVPAFLTRAKIDDRVTMLLAGRAAEALMLGSVSSAAGGDSASDLALATNLIALAHTSLGLGDDLIWRGGADDTLTRALADPALRVRVTEELGRISASATTILSENRPALTKVAEAVLQRTTISGDDLRSIVSTASTRPHVMTSGTHPTGRDGPPGAARRLNQKGRDG